MTEEEAKTKWCPFTFAPAAPPVDGKSGSMMFQYPPREEGFQRTCIGSACMVWRWFGTHIQNPENGNTTDLIWSTRTHGTCGLAGPWYAEDRRP